MLIYALTNQLSIEMVAAEISQFIKSKRTRSGHLCCSELHSINHGRRNVLKSGTAQTETPKASRRGRAEGASIEAPKAPRGVGSGQPPPRKIFFSFFVWK